MLPALLRKTSLSFLKNQKYTATYLLSTGCYLLHTQLLLLWRAVILPVALRLLASHYRCYYLFGYYIEWSAACYSDVIENIPSDKRSCCNNYSVLCTVKKCVKWYAFNHVRYSYQGSKSSLSGTLVGGHNRCPGKPGWETVAGATRRPNNSRT